MLSIVSSLVLFVAASPLSPVPRAQEAWDSGWHLKAKLLIDIPGIEWAGKPRDHHMGELLSPDRVTIHVRHASERATWKAPDPSHRVIYLPDTTSAVSKRRLESELHAAFDTKKDVHVVFDTNLKAADHLITGRDRSEDRWAAAHADAVLALKPPEYDSIVATHSRGTVAPLYMQSKDLVNRFIIMSPRGDDALRWIESLPHAPRVDIVQGVTDAPAFRYGDIPGVSQTTNTERLAQDNANVRLYRLQDLADPWTTHGRLQNPQTNGFWDVIDGPGETRQYGTLAQIMHRSGLNEAHRPTVVRSWWIDDRDMSTSATQLAAARALTNMARDKRSVVVVGNGPAADRMAQDMSRGLGDHNVLRLAATNDVLGVQQRARDFGADLILGVRDQHFNSRYQEQSILAVRENAENLASGVTVLAEGLETWGARDKPGAWARDSLKWSTRLYDVAKGIEADLASRRAGDFVLVRSETLEALGRVGVDIGFEALADRASDALGVDAVPTFGAEEFVHATARTIRDGRADITTIEHFLDGAVGATWAGAGWVVGRSVGLDPWKTASTAQDVGLFLAKVGRTKTQGLADRFVAWTQSGRHRRLSEQDSANWERAVGNLERNGQVVQARQLLLLREAGASQADLAGYIASINGPLTRTVEPQHLTTSETVGELTRRERSAHDVATRLTPDTRRTVVFGYGPAASHTYDALVDRHGRANVKWVHSLPSVPERMRVAQDFGADTIRSVQHDRYQRTSWTRSLERVEVRAGHRSVTPLPLREPALPRWSAPKSRSSFTATPVPARSFRSPGVGGVMLGATANVDGMRSEEFSLVFTDSEGEVDVEQLQMFMTALWAVYFSQDGPGISIDPIAEGVDKHLVRYIGRVLNSDLGRVMRETDYMMKKWATGAERPDLPGFENPDDIAGRYGRMNVGVPSRFWFVPEGLSFTKTDGLLLFTDGRMTLKTEYLLSGGGDKSDPANEEFAHAFTNSYTAVSERYPIFRELFEYAKLVSIAKFLKEERVPLLWFLLTNRDMILTEDSPGTVDAFVTNSKHFRGVTIEGGVDLAIRPSAARYKIDPEAATALRELAQRRSEVDEGTAPFVAEDGLRFRLAEVDYAATRSQELTLAMGGGGTALFQTDFALRVDGEPSLELVRYHDPTRTGQFGADWHLMVPYAVSPASDERVQVQNVTLPRLVRVTSLLTGAEEILAYDNERYSIEGWVPPEESTSITLGLFLLTDGTFRLADRLGSEFQFDQGGRLTGMYLTEDYAVDYEYEPITAQAADFDEVPYRLVPETDETIEDGGLRFPVRVRLLGADGESESFAHARDRDETFHRYVSERSKVGMERQLVPLTDGSFVFTDGSGARTQFSRAGHFRSLTVPVVTKMKQDDVVLDFEYGFDGLHFRVESVSVDSESAAMGGERIEYSYDAEGRLCSASSPSMGVVLVGTPE